MKNFKLKFLLLFFVSAISTQTTSQINKARKYIKTTGISTSEIKEKGLEQGYSLKEIEEGLEAIDIESSQDKNINKKVDLVNLESSVSDISFESDGSTDVENQEDMQNKDFDEILVEGNKIVESLNTFTLSSYFGYNIFKNDPSLFQESLFGAIDPEYLIGPGDEIIFMLWGETQFRQVATVNREGFIFIPEVGQVFVNGLNLKFLESKLFKILSKSYESINPQVGRATTFLDVSLGELRPLRIQVLGEVAQPGAYTMSHSSTIFSSLYYFNGPTKLGSLRDIRLIRNNEVVKSIDFYDFLLTGKKIKDEKLQIDDVIYIPKRKKTVTIKGEINRPAIYELKENETLIDLISIASGLKASAYIERLQIDRIIPFIDRDSLKMERIKYDISLSDVLEGKIKIEILDMDIIHVESIMENRQNTVRISGAVNRPGEYDINKSPTILQLIQNSGGLLGDVYWSRLDIVRTEKDFTKKLIKLNVKNVIENDSSSNIKLNINDEITIYSLSEMEPSKFVYIEGNVYNPGEYQLIEGMRIYDLIFKAGGLQDSLFLNKTYIKRADLIRKNKNKGEKIIESFNLETILVDQNDKSNILLKAEDVVKIYSKNLFFDKPYVEVNGSIQNPGKYFYKVNMDLKDLILEAGGFFPKLNDFIVEISSLQEKKEGGDYEARTKKIKLISSDFYENISSNKPFHILDKYDIVSIRRRSENQLNQNSVNLIGNFKYPGQYTLLNSNEFLSDMIERSGGLTENAYPFAATFLRKEKKIQIDVEKLLEKPRSKFDIILYPGDKIIIEGRPNIISISGLVNTPGFYKFTENLKISDYIKMAGGVTNKADPKNIHIKYSNGISKKYIRIFGDHRVRDGSLLVVKPKKESEPFNVTEYLKEASSIVANLVQVISILILAKG